MTLPSDHHLGEDLGAMALGGQGLTSAREAYLSEHIAECAACRNALLTAQLVQSTVENMPPVEPSNGFDRALFRQIDALDRASLPPVARRLAELFIRPRLISMVVAIGALIIIGVTTLLRRVQTPAPPPAEPAMSWMTPEVAENLEGLAFAEDLDLLADLEVFDNLEELDEWEEIQSLDVGGRR